MAKKYDSDGEESCENPARSVKESRPSPRGRAAPQVLLGKRWLGGRPAIFASAVMRDEVTIQHLKNMGVRWFLEKPFRLSALRLILEEARELLDKRAA